MDDTGRSGIDFLRKTLMDNLDKLGLNKLEILYDSYRNLPLSLRPYSKPISHESEDEEVSSPIRIYDEQTDTLTPIEDLSIAIESLSKGVPRIARIYAARNVHDQVSKFAEEYKKSIQAEA